MNSKLFFLTFGILLLLPTIMAAQTLGTFKINEEINLVQTCDASSYSNITRITNPDSTFALNAETAMEKSGDNYNYTFLDTDQIGQYLVYGHCDEDSTDTEWVYDFSTTPSGSSGLTTFTWIILVVAFGIIVLGYTTEEPVIIVLGSLGLYFVSMDILLNGIDGVRNLATTWALGLVTLGVALYLSIRAGLELLGK